jgi:hypothetical protein
MTRGFNKMGAYEKYRPNARRFSKKGLDQLKGIQTVIMVRNSSQLELLLFRYPKNQSLTEFL